MDILVITDTDSILIDKYWLDIIVTQTKKYFTVQELELEEIDELYFQYDDYAMALGFYKQSIEEKAFNIFYNHCLQAYKDYPNTNAAKAHFVDSKSGLWRDRNVLEDYLNPEIEKELLKKGESEGYFDDTEQRKEEFQEFIGFVSRWWKELLDFLKENYGKPAPESKE